jgi:hypothetical protein
MGLDGSFIFKKNDSIKYRITGTKLFLFPLTSFLRPTNHKAIGAKAVTVHGCFHYLWFPSRVIGGVIGKRARDSSSLSTSRPPASLPSHRSSSAASVHCAVPPPLWPHPPPAYPPPWPVASPSAVGLPLPCSRTLLSLPAPPLINNLKT